MEPERSLPFILRPDNFTPPARTPWGGQRIRELKREAFRTWGIPTHAGVVGESWELSYGPEYPSRSIDSGSLASFIADDPLAILGDEALAGRRGTALLVKLLDAAENLSVQIHPTDNSELLMDGESGKPECWYVTHAQPGAGVYFGLREGTNRNEMAARLSGGGDCSELLEFVPVRAGDFFVVEPGTAHAIGAGVTLVEPQLVVPGRKGITWRYWDWNRKYDSKGTASATGEPRELHVAQALAVTAWNGPRSGELVAHARARAKPPALDAAVEHLELLTNATIALSVSRVAGTGRTTLRPASTLRALTVLEGHITIEAGTTPTRLVAGMTAALPACMQAVECNFDRGSCIVSRATLPTPAK